MDYVTVKSGRDDGRVAFWEQNESHPNGEAYIATQKPVKIAKTPAALKALSIGDLVEVQTEKAKPSTAAKK